MHTQIVHIYMYTCKCTFLYIYTYGYLCVYTCLGSLTDKSYITGRERERGAYPSVRSANTHNSELLVCEE